MAHLFRSPSRGRAQGGALLQDRLREEGLRMVRFFKIPSRGRDRDGGGKSPNLRLFVRSVSLVYATEILRSVLHEDLVCLALGGDVVHEGVLVV